MVMRSTQGDIIKELERRLKVSDPVIKYQTIRLDEELKRQQKLGEASRAPRQPPSAQASAGQRLRRAVPQQQPQQQPQQVQASAPAADTCTSRRISRGTQNDFYKRKETRCPISRAGSAPAPQQTTRLRAAPHPHMRPAPGGHRSEGHSGGGALAAAKVSAEAEEGSAVKAEVPAAPEAGWRSRRPAPWRQAPVFPQEESLPLLRRARGLHRLQEGRDASALRAGARQDSAAPHDRHLLAPPALAGRSHQAGAQHRAAAVRDRAVKKEKATT